jgi:hypothetical protein
MWLFLISLLLLIGFNGVVTQLREINTTLHKISMQLEGARK